MKQLLFFLVLSFVACQSSKNEAVHLEDIIAQSKSYKEGEIKNDPEPENLEEVKINLNKELLSELNINCENKTISDSLLFPDRFSPITSIKFNYKTDKEVVNFAKYKFRDSLKTQNAFINWVNCFGTQCSSIRIGESKNLQKNGFLLMVNDTCIIYLSLNSASEKKKWLNYFTNEKDLNWKYILDQNKYGKVNWKSYKDNSFIVIENKIKTE